MTDSFDRDISGCKFMENKMSMGYVYLEIKEDMLARILCAEFLPGEKIPPVRESATYYNANPNTVSKAYRVLYNEGIITRKHSNGYYVVENGERIQDMKEKMYKYELEKFVLRMKRLGLKLDMEKIYGLM